MEQDIGVGHSGDVVGYDAGEALGLDLFVVALGELFWIFDPVVEEGGDDFFCLVVLEFELRAGVEVVVEVLLFLDAFGFDFGREGGDSLAVEADALQGFERVELEVGAGGVDEVVGEDVLHKLQGLVEEVLLVDLGVLAFDDIETAREDADVLADVVDLEQARFDAVVEVGGEVGDLVGEVDDLGFERWGLV